MVKVHKVAKTTKHSKSRISSFVKMVRKQHKKDKTTIGIKTYKKKLQGISIGTSNSSKNFKIPEMEPIKRKSIVKEEIKYQIAIPTYKRSDLIQKKTLAILHHYKINPDIITLFVADENEANEYKEKVPKHLYGKIIIGVKGLKNQRNFISKYYSENIPVVQFDDDINKIVQLVSRTSTKQLQPLDDLDKLIKYAFDICIKNGIYLWGIYPLAKAYFMTNKITTDLRFIVGPMWGMINRHSPDLQLTIDEKENSERTLQFWNKDKTVLRFNNIGIDTAYYKNKGGMQEELKDRKVEALKSVYYLHKKYPNITKIYLGKKSGMPEIKLLRTKKKI